jgi:DNA primase
VNQTQQRVADVLNVTAENPEKKIIEMLNQARKERIMLDKIQDDFFELCHQHYLGESVIIS